MKKLAAFSGALAVLILSTSPALAAVDCGAFCTNHCAEAHPNNPGARGACYGGCVSGCQAAQQVEP